VNGNESFGKIREQERIKADPEYYNDLIGNSKHRTEKGLTCDKYFDDNEKATIREYLESTGEQEIGLDPAIDFANVNHP
jgi:hypothetical protein